MFEEWEKIGLSLTHIRDHKDPLVGGITMIVYAKVGGPRNVVWAVEGSKQGATFL